MASSTSPSSPSTRWSSTLCQVSVDDRSSAPRLRIVAWRGPFGAAVPPSLVLDEGTQERQADGRAEPDGEADPIAAEQAVCQQRDTGAGDDRVDEGDHGGGRGQERDER